MMEIIKVSSRGQMVIPERMRKHLKIKEGSRLVLVERGKSLLIKKEEDVEKEMKEDLGWMMLSETSLKEVWNNSKDEKEWKKYLDSPDIS